MEKELQKIFNEQGIKFGKYITPYLVVQDIPVQDYLIRRELKRVSSISKVVGNAGWLYPKHTAGWPKWDLIKYKIQFNTCLRKQKTVDFWAKTMHLPVTEVEEFFLEKGYPIKYWDKVTEDVPVVRTVIHNGTAYTKEDLIEYSRKKKGRILYYKFLVYTANRKFRIEICVAAKVYKEAYLKLQFSSRYDRELVIPVQYIKKCTFDRAPRTID